MGKVHYGWGLDSDNIDEDSKHVCGTRIAEFDYYESSQEKDITCKKCLKNIKKYKKQHEIQEELICEEMGKMYDYFEKNKI